MLWFQWFLRVMFVLFVGFSKKSKLRKWWLVVQIYFCRCFSQLRKKKIPEKIFPEKISSPDTILNLAHNHAFKDIKEKKLRYMKKVKQRKQVPVCRVWFYEERQLKMNLIKSSKWLRNDSPKKLLSFVSDFFLFWKRYLHQKFHIYYNTTFYYVYIVFIVIKKGL